MARPTWVLPVHLLAAALAAVVVVTLVRRRTSTLDVALFTVFAQGILVVLALGLADAQLREVMALAVLVPPLFVGIVAGPRQVLAQVPLAERIRPDVEGTTSGVAVTVSVSVGVATGPLAPEGVVRSVELLLAEADERLYEAKRGGRNRVRATAPTPSAPAPQRLLRNSGEVSGMGGHEAFPCGSCWSLLLSLVSNGC